MALIDTGATRTCLTPRVIRELDLPLRARMLVASAQNAPERRRAYGFTLGIFCDSIDQFGSTKTLHVFEEERVAPDFRDNDNFDVLLGMDILSTGRLLFDKNSFEFSF